MYLLLLLLQAQCHSTTEHCEQYVLSMPQQSTWMFIIIYIHTSEIPQEYGQSPTTKPLGAFLQPRKKDKILTCKRVSTVSNVKTVNGPVLRTRTIFPLLVLVINNFLLVFKITTGTCERQSNMHIAHMPEHAWFIYVNIKCKMVEKIIYFQMGGGREG